MSKAILNGIEVRDSLGLSKVITTETRLTFHKKGIKVHIKPVNETIKNTARSKYHVAITNIHDEEE